jgi:undecaprenyl diphosphate synthase
VTRSDPSAIDKAAAGDNGQRREQILERMRRINPTADPLTRLPDVPVERIPRHIAIIMDGNGRWARQRGFERIIGHRNGVRVVREVMAECGRLGVEALTLYSFSTENWKRPRDEIEGLMTLGADYLDKEREQLIEKNIRLRMIGRRDGLPGAFLSAMDRTIEATASNTGPILCLAVNYAGRAEITDAMQRLARRVAAGELAPAAINESLVSANLDTAGMPDPDLLIRTSGEMRVSNFLLWQISYAELYVTDVYWPDFGTEHLHAAIRDYAKRNRRFGGLENE